MSRDYSEVVDAWLTNHPGRKPWRLLTTAQLIEVVTLTEQWDSPTAYNARRALARRKESK